MDDGARVGTQIAGDDLLEDDPRSGFAAQPSQSRTEAMIMTTAVSPCMPSARARLPRFPRMISMSPIGISDSIRINHGRASGWTNVITSGATPAATSRIPLTCHHDRAGWSGRAGQSESCGVRFVSEQVHRADDDDHQRGQPGEDKPDHVHAQLLEVRRAEAFAGCWIRAIPKCRLVVQSRPAVGLATQVDRVFPVASVWQRLRRPDDRRCRRPTSCLRSGGTVARQ